MAMISVNCPSCGLSQEIDQEKGFGFCTECGTKIELNPVPSDVNSGDDSILASLSEALKNEGNFVTNLSGVDECNVQFDRWIGLVGKYKELIPTLDSDLNKETAINEILDFCDKVSKTKISYLVGEVGKDGKNLIKVYTPDKSRTSAIKDAKAYFRSMFNNLPVRLELSRQLTEGLDLANDRVSRLKVSVKETRDKFKASEKEFWNEYPEVTNRKRDVKLSSLRIIVIGAMLAIVAIVIACVKRFYPCFVIAALVLGASFYFSRRHTEKSISKIKLECFPESLKQLQSLLESYEKEYDQAEIDLKNAQDKMAEFDASRK